MTASQVLRILGRVLMLGFLAFVAVGCGITPSPTGDASRYRSTTPYRYERPSRGAEHPERREYERPTPQAEPAKPVDATEEMEERHPSMWKRKLRALYASAN